MNFLKLVKARYSERKYTNRPVEKEKLEYVMECVRLAPSAVNLQPWKFMLVETPETIEKIRQCYHREWFATAPLYLIACADTSLSWKRRIDGKDHGEIDVSIAVEHLCLAATEQGLGTCWVCNFDVQLCRQLFDIPAHLIPVALIPLGYPESVELPEKTRKSLEEILVRV